MTDHNATWDESQYEHDSDVSEETETDDPMVDWHGKQGYWDYPDED